MDFLWMISLLKAAAAAFLLYQAVDYAFCGRPVMKTACIAYILYLTVDYLVNDRFLLKTAALACLLYITVDVVVYRIQEIMLARKGKAPHSLNLSRLTQARRWQCDAIRLVDEAYKKFPGKVFQAYSHKGPQVFIPRNMMDEVRVLPDNILSSKAAHKDFFESDHTLGPDPDNQIGVMWTRKILGQHLDDYTEIIKEELIEYSDCVFAYYEDWEQVPIYGLFCLLVGRFTCRIFLGPLDWPGFYLWITETVQYLRNLSKAIGVMKFFPRWLRSMSYYVNPWLWKCHGHLYLVTALVEALLEGPNTKDALHGINDLLPEDKRQDFFLQGRSHIGLSLAAFQTTVRVLYHVIFDIAEHSEYISILREEFMNVFGNSLFHKDPRYTVENFGRLEKLDSVIKESARLHGGDVGSFRRKLLRNITLSDGTYLPEGTTLFSPTWSLSHDASIFPNPDTFDGLRFFHMRHASHPDLNRHLFTTIDNTATYFGVGKHACPGRAFASVEIKMILVHLLMRYDFKLVDGDTKPRDYDFEGILVPSQKNIMIRNRQAF